MVREIPYHISLATSLDAKCILVNPFDLRCQSGIYALIKTVTSFIVTFY